MPNAVPGGLPVEDWRFTLDGMRILLAIVITLTVDVVCAAPTAFLNVNVVPMTDNRIIGAQTVIVEEGIITVIGDVDTVPVPKDAVVVDGTDRYLMPGLADMHVHLKGEWPLSQLDLYLANGVTTIRDLDGRDFMLHWRQEIRRDELGSLVDQLTRRRRLKN